MNLFRNKNKQIEKQRPTFFTIGLICAFALVLTAFEWQTMPEFVSNPAEGLAQEPIYIWTPPKIIPKKQQNSLQAKKQKNQKTIIDIFKIEKDDKPLFEDSIFIYEIEDSSLVIMELPPEVIIEPPIRFPDVSPEFPGGLKELYKYLGNEINYPKEIAGVEGRVYTTFVVEKDGSITGIQLTRGLHPFCDNEVIEALKKMPKWNPGYRNDHAVRVQFNLPVSFKTMP